MPPKMRPPNVATLHGERSIKVQRLVSVLTKVDQRCKAASQAATPSDQHEVLEEQRTRSKVAKKLYKLYLLDCIECNMRNIEAFPEEVAQIGQGTLCHHGKVIQQIMPADPEEQPQYPAI